MPYHNAPPSAFLKKTEGQYDLWGGGEELPLSGRKHHAPKGIPNAERQNSIPLPHPGQSVNPTKEDHDAAIEEATEKLLRREADLTRQIKKFASRGVHAQLSTSGLTTKELSAAAMVGAQGAEEDETDMRLGAHSKATRRLTKKDKRKQKERRLAEIEAYRKDRDQAMAQDIGRLHKLKEELAEEAQERAKRRATKTKKVKYGRNVVVSSALDVTEEAPVSVRAAMGGAVHPLKEQLESLQRRGVVEATRPHVKKDRKISSYRWTFNKENKFHLRGKEVDHNDAKK